MRANTLATEARNDYAERPYFGGRPEPGFMSGGFAVHRDSDPLEQSNHAIAAERYRAAGVDVQVDPFNHWAVGWVDYLTVPITPAAIRVLRELTDAYDAYPALDEDDWSQREWESNHPDGYCYTEGYDCCDRDEYGRIRSES
jgi:hypothetical protein